MSAYDQNSLGSIESLMVDISEPIKLACGVVLDEHQLMVETYGTLNADRSNAILICHALSGSHHAAGWHDGDRKPGWWNHYIGPGKAIDSRRFFIVCPNNIGSCFGSTGPTTINPATQQPWGPDFPPLRARDWMESQHLLMQHLGITCWAAVVGGSLGGMQAMRWSLEYPEKLLNSIVIASAMKLSAQNIAFNEIARRAIKSDPDYLAGRYLENHRVPRHGLALARMIGHVTYLSDVAMAEKFGRELNIGNFSVGEKDPIEFQIESYLNYQGDKFADDFDANAYILITKMLDYFDLSRDYQNDPAAAFKHASCNFMVISFTSDWRFPAQRSREITDALIGAGRNVSYAEIQSDQGHDAFLLPNPRYEEVLSGYLSRVADQLKCSTT